jgi:hypothetical protein
MDNAMLHSFDYKFSLLLLETQKSQIRKTTTHCQNDAQTCTNKHAQTNAKHSTCTNTDAQTLMHKHAQTMMHKHAQIADKRTNTPQTCTNLKQMPNTQHAQTHHKTIHFNMHAGIAFAILEPAPRMTLNSDPT